MTRIYRIYLFHYFVGELKSAKDPRRAHTLRAVLRMLVTRDPLLCVEDALDWSFENDHQTTLRT
jgi:hypothetical protein